MLDLSTLHSHYEFWDEVVRQWKSGKYPSVLHLPEPWWGWCANGDDLHSVCINLNPGKGTKLQSRRCTSCFMECMRCDSYYAGMLDGTLRSHLDYGERWHHKYRYKPLMRALGVEESHIFPDTRHHLSVELAPFHEQISNELFSKQQPEDIILHTLKFAAEASRNIVSPLSRKIKSPLRNRVIARCSINNIRQIARDYIIAISLPIELENKKSIEVSAFRLKESGYENIWFICISGAHNHLLQHEIVKQIIESANKQLKFLNKKV